MQTHVSLVHIALHPSQRLQMLKHSNILSPEPKRSSVRAPLRVVSSPQRQAVGICSWITNEEPGRNQEGSLSTSRTASSPFRCVELA